MQPVQRRTPPGSEEDSGNHKRAQAQQADRVVGMRPGARSRIMGRDGAVAAEPRHRFRAQLSRHRCCRWGGRLSRRRTEHTGQRQQHDHEHALHGARACSTSDRDTHSGSILKAQP
ncbi:hypothetical protein GCM10023198_20770 [Promicromonospora umidemergens]|uniref:Uncharacterized protein n=1 Tax=Promicromonospora umidemergens TaxID=629679 RepID=A0ABP8X707_9MICO